MFPFWFRILLFLSGFLYILVAYILLYCAGSDEEKDSITWTVRCIVHLALMLCGISTLWMAFKL